MALQFAAERALTTQDTDECFPIALTADTGADGATGCKIEIKPMLDVLLAELSIAGGALSSQQVDWLALRFHNTLAQMVLQVAQREAVAQVALSGGCFQNRLLLASARRRLERSGFAVYAPERFPPNDGALSLGQAWIARGNDSVSRDPR